MARKKRKKIRQNIVVFCAHNDDHVIGAGGALAKYAKDGFNIYTYIFSYGESSHPHLDSGVIIKTRVKESRNADKAIGGKGTFYLGLAEGKFAEEVEQREFKDKIKSYIFDKKPAKIFTHSKDDPHPDHRAVFRVVSEVLKDIAKKMKFDSDIYMFDVWNPLAARGRNAPKLVVDVSDTFKQKINAMKCHKSQKAAMIFMYPAVYSRAVINGLNYHTKYAEVFYKLN